MPAEQPKKQTSLSTRHFFNIMLLLVTQDEHSIHISSKGKKY